MAKYLTVLCLIAMGITIAVIDARSTDMVRTGRNVVTDIDRPSKIYATGFVEGATENIKLVAEQSGRVREALVTEGQWVNAGDVLIRLDNARQQQEVALASAHLELAKAELERLQNGARAEEREEAAALSRVAEARMRQAVRNLKVNEQLRRERAITQQETDDQQSLVDTTRSELEAAQARLKLLESPARADEVRKADARVAGAEAELSLAKIGLSKTELRAPCHGRVLEIHGEPGELSGPEATLPLVVLCDTSKVRVRAYVEELDASRDLLGMSACVTADGLPIRSFRGKVVSISPQMEPKQLRVGHASELYDVLNREVVIDLPEAASIPVGLRVDVLLQDKSSQRPGHK